MAMTQVELIRALDETLRWFERELQWGVAPRDLEHLVTRIGRIFTAINCNGQIVSDPTVVGYSVVGSYGDKYQVQCVTGSEVIGEINFSREQLEIADRVAVLFFNSDEIEIESLLDVSVEELASYITSHHGNKLIIPLETLLRTPEEKSVIKVIREVNYRDYTLCELENGEMTASLNGTSVTPVKLILQKLATELDVPQYNGMERSLNTRLLGTQVIQAIEVKHNK